MLPLDQFKLGLSVYLNDCYRSTGAGPVPAALLTSGDLFSDCDFTACNCSLFFYMRNCSFSCSLRLKCDVVFCIKLAYFLSLFVSFECIQNLCLSSFNVETILFKSTFLIFRLKSF